MVVWYSAFKYFTDQTKPDIIVGTESWITTAKSLTQNNIQYLVKIGKGKGDEEKHSLKPTSQPELDSSAEVIWAKVDVPGLKNVYICSYYKPKENDEDSLEGLRSSLYKIPSSSIIWALGDFNLPHIDWDKIKIKDSCNHKPIYEHFFDFVHDFALEQLVKEPTRDNNTLDLFLTNHTKQVQSTKTHSPLLAKGS